MIKRGVIPYLNRISPINASVFPSSQLYKLILKFIINFPSLTGDTGHY